MRSHFWFLFIITTFFTKFNYLRNLFDTYTFNYLYCMIYSGPGFLAVVWFGSSSTPSPLPSACSTGDKQEDYRQRDNLLRGAGVGKLAKSDDGKRAWSSIKHSLFSLCSTWWCLVTCSVHMIPHQHFLLEGGRGREVEGGGKRGRERGREGDEKYALFWFLSSTHCCSTVRLAFLGGPRGQSFEKSLEILGQSTYRGGWVK